MKDSLRQLKKDLKAYAKRCKDFKYTETAVIIFMLVGLLGINGNLFSDTSMIETEVIEKTKEINNSINFLGVDFKKARKENDKLLKELELELIQLTEQGDQVVKSPWSNWQIGMNYNYNNWNGIYKGRGDKTPNIRYTRNGGKLGTGSSVVTHGSTSLGNIVEPISAVPVDAAVNPKNIDKLPPSFTVSGAGGGLPAFSTRTVTEATAPTIATPNAPTNFTPPALNFVGSGFGQSWHIGAIGQYRYGDVNGSTTVVVENYQSYNTNGVFDITMGASSTNWNGTMNMASTTSEVIGFAGGWLGGASLPLNDTLTTRSAGSMAAFINELRDHDAQISGTYKMTNNSGGQKIFLSHNPAGRSTGDGFTDMAGTGGTNPTGYWLGLSAKRTAIFDATLELHGNANSGITVGVEHQQWDRQDNYDGYSIFENRGTITLASGKEVIGIMIDTEANNLIGMQKHNNNQTVNNGKIVINNTDSIGIDFGDYNPSDYIPVDVTLGDIEVNGSHNYGFRMKNLTNRATKDTYYDDVTVSGGTGKTIKVAGTENVGLAIGKSLSSGVAESHTVITTGAMGGSYTESGNLNYQKLDGNNPISNFFGINVTLAGDKGIGILRLSDYSTNNTNDFIFNTQNIGVFNIDGATNSTLLRTDNGGMTIANDITMAGATGGVNALGTAAGNTIGHANGIAQHVHNNANITTGENLKNTTGLAATGGGTAPTTPVVNIKNTGTIELKGTGSIGMYTGLGTTGENDGATTGTTGAIRLKGVDSNNLGGNTGIYNAGTFEVKKGTIEISGGNSVGIFNTGTTTITGDTKVIGDKGATGIYGSSGTVTGTTDGVTIDIDDTALPSISDKRGIGVYATGSGTSVNIGNANTKITVKDGGAGVFATNLGTIDISNGLLDYTGKGYALYTSNSGTINASNSTVNLGGESVGFIIDGSGGSYASGVNLAGATINVNSDDVILASIKNHPSSLNLSNFDTVAILTPTGLNYTGVAGTATDYKIGVVEGLNGANKFNIDQTLDKSLAVAGSPLSSATQDQKFTRNFLIQRSIIDVNADINAVLSSSDANTIKKVSSGAAVVGLDISSTSNAVNNTDTQIVVNTGTVKADRTDAGSGAIGLYTNYGIIDVKAGATVDVETDTSNTVNEMAVGLYAVNGSEIRNAGTIKAGGKNSIGALALAYREDASGTVIGNEFGKLTEGVATVTNSGTIELDGEEAKGILIKNNSISGLNQAFSGTTSVAQNIATNDAGGTIKLTGEKAVGIYADEATAINKGTIDLQGAKNQIGLYGTSTSGTSGRDSVLQNDTTGVINVGNSTLAGTSDVPNIAIFTEAENVVINKGTINVGDDSYGIYAKNIIADNSSVFSVNSNGVGIFAVGTPSSAGNIVLNNGARVTVNNGLSGKEGTAVFTGGSNTVNVVDNGSVMDLKDSTFGFVLKAPGTFVNTSAGTVNMTTDAIYVYTDSGATVTNNAPVTSNGNKNYALYGNGTMENYAPIDFTLGTGNVGIYSTGGTATNYNVIKVGETNTSRKEFGVGMATGYYDQNNTVSPYSNQGTIINRGTIEVSKENTMGMYATGPNSTAINYGDINLSGNNTVGMYLDGGAKGENWGNIVTIASGLTGVKGIYLARGSFIKNYGTIRIEATDTKSAGIWSDTQSQNNAEENATGTNPVTGTSQTGTSTPSMKVVTADDMKEVGGVIIKVPPRANPVTVTDANGNTIPIVKVDTNVLATNNPTEVIVTTPNGITTLDLSSLGLNNFANATEVGSLAMYIDTSGVNYTNPIQGLSNLTGLTDISLMFGVEAARYTNAKAIEIGDNILDPYNTELSTVVTAGTTLNVTSGSLTWMAQPTKDATTGLLDTVYLVKIPYQSLAGKGDTQTSNFLALLDEKYDTATGRDKDIFNKLNDLGKGEAHILAQAIDQMKGHQYSNVQQRINETGNVLEKEFGYLQNEWKNPTKQNNKIKAFGFRGEYKTDSAGVEDYVNKAYGVAYVHEDETVKLGRNSGWYAGAVTNMFEFKDLGGSKETQTLVKAGIFKTISPAKDHNGSLQWKISGEGFVGHGDMKRKFWVVDETFEAKGDYTIYGVGLKNELSKTIRVGNRTSIKPYASLDLEYGRFTNIEETGDMALDIKGNDYFSVKPEVGIGFNYRQPVGVRSYLSAELTAGYETELGSVRDVKNKAKIKGTNGERYTLRGDKESRRGNGKFDLNLGWDNQRFGITVNAGYDTEGENVRGGIGFRAIY